MSDENEEVLEEEEILEEDRGNELGEESEESEEEESEESEEEESEESEESEEEESEEEESEEDIRIPKSRLNEVISQRDEQKDRVQWLEEQLSSMIEKTGKEAKAAPVKETKPEYDFSKSETEYASLLIEGETVKASLVRSEIDEERRLQTVALIEEVRESSVKETSIETSKAIDDEKFDSLILNYQNKYSFLDSESDDYNEEAVETVNTLLAGYVSSGKTRSQSLSSAVKKAVPLYKKSETPTKPTLGNKRKKDAISKSAKASRNQPPVNKGKKAENVDLDAVDIARLSEKDFRNLTSKERSVLRGD